jgi:hypothetical protein
MVRKVQKSIRKREEKATWYADWQPRLLAIVRHGLPIKVIDVTIADDEYGFIGMELEVDELVLPRAHHMRNFPLHLSIGFLADYNSDIAREAVARIRARWSGEWMMLKIERYTSGGTVVLSKDDLLFQDEDIHWLHTRGWYGSGKAVRPRSLHISL